MTCRSLAKSYPILWDPMGCSTPCFPVLHYILKFAQTRPLSRWCHPTISSSDVPFSSCPQSFPAYGFFQWASSSHLVVKVLDLQLQRQFFQWISVLISFRIDWFDLLAVQGTLKNLLQHHNWTASTFWCLPFFIVQVLHNDYWEKKKPITLTI